MEHEDNEESEKEVEKEEKSKKRIGAKGVYEDGKKFPKNKKKSSAKEKALEKAKK